MPQAKIVREDLLTIVSNLGCLYIGFYYILNNKIVEMYIYNIHNAEGLQRTKLLKFVSIYNYSRMKDNLT